MNSQTLEYNSSLEAQKQEFIQRIIPEKNIRVQVGSPPDKIQDQTYRKRIKFISLDLLYSNNITVNPLISTNLTTFLLLKMNVEKTISEKNSSY